MWIESRISCFNDERIDHECQKKGHLSLFFLGVGWLEQLRFFFCLPKGGKFTDKKDYQSMWDIVDGCLIWENFEFYYNCAFFPFAVEQKNTFLFDIKGNKIGDEFELMFRVDKSVSRPKSWIPSNYHAITLWFWSLRIIAFALENSTSFGLLSNRSFCRVEAKSEMDKIQDHSK